AGVATVGDALGRGQVCGGGDPGAWVGAVLPWTEHRVALLAPRFGPALYAKRLLGATRCSRYSLKYWAIMTTLICKLTCPNPYTRFADTAKLREHTAIANAPPPQRATAPQVRGPKQGGTHATDVWRATARSAWDTGRLRPRGGRRPVSRRSCDG